MLFFWLFLFHFRAPQKCLKCLSCDESQVCLIPEAETKKIWWLDKWVDRRNESVLVFFYYKTWLSLPAVNRSRVFLLVLQWVFVVFFPPKMFTLSRLEVRVSHERVVYFCLMTSGRTLHTFHRTFKPNYPSYQGLIWLPGGLIIATLPERLSASADETTWVKLWFKAGCQRTQP